MCVLPWVYLRPMHGSNSKPTSLHARADPYYNECKSEGGFETKIYEWARASSLPLFSKAYLWARDGAKSCTRLARQADQTFAARVMGLKGSAQSFPQISLRRSRHKKFATLIIMVWCALPQRIRYAFQYLSINGHLRRARSVEGNFSNFQSDEFNRSEYLHRTRQTPAD